MKDNFFIVAAKLQAQAEAEANIADAKAILAEAQAYTPIVLSMLASTKQSLQASVNASLTRKG
tara:strand:+ start:3539 stop:3727 length:189 start_codon:yes stop_codon:yes gene_type:complete